MKGEEESRKELKDSMESLRRELSRLEEIKIRRTSVRRALHDSEEVWQLLIEKISDIIMTVDRDGTILAINRTVKGFTVTNTIGTKLFEYMPPDQAKMVRKKIAKVHRTGRPSSYEILGAGIDGDKAWYETRVLPVTNEGTVTATIHICEDITARKQAEEALRDSEARYRALFEASLDGVVIADAESRRFKYVNPAMCSLIGYSQEELSKMEISDIHPDHAVELAMSEFDALAGGKKHIVRDMPFERKDGTVVYFNVSAVITTIDDRKHNVAFFRDVTERKKTEDELKQKEKHYRKLWNDAPVAYHVLDTEGRVIDVNRTEARLLGYEPEEMVGRPIFDFIAVEERPEAERWFQMKIAGHRFPNGHDRLYARKDGSTLQVSIDDVLEYGRDGAVTAIRTTLLDVTERRRAEETIRRMAYYDALTGLPNRTLFGMRLATALVHAHRMDEKLVVMLLDLDHFKNVNDSLGHRVGDELLKAVGRRLANVIRGGDTVARMGGDEFLVVAPEIHDERGAEDIAGRMMETVRKPIACGGRTLNVTASIGIAMYPRDGTENGILVKNADIAMYRAKSAGRNTYRIFTRT